MKLAPLVSPARQGDADRRILADALRRKRLSLGIEHARRAQSHCAAGKVAMLMSSSAVNFTWAIALSLVGLRRDDRLNHVTLHLNALPVGRIRGGRQQDQTQDEDHAP